MKNRDIRLSPQFKTQTTKAILSIAIFVLTYIIILLLAGALTAQKDRHNRCAISGWSDSPLAGGDLSVAIFHSRVAVRLLHSRHRRRRSQILRQRPRRIPGARGHLSRVDGRDQGDVDHKRTSALARARLHRGLLSLAG